MAQMKDSLWWAAKRGDEQLARRLLMAHDEFGSFRKNEAACCAIKHGHPALLELIVDNPLEVMTLLDDQKKHVIENKSFHLFKPIIEKIDFAKLSEQEQRSMIVQASEFDAQDLVRQWIALLPPQMGIKTIGQQLIKKNWVDAFDALHQWAKDHGSPQIDDGDLLRSAIEYDAYDIWARIPQWRMATQHHVRYYGARILQDIWHDLSKKSQKHICDNTQNDEVLKWLLEQKKLSQKNTTNILQRKVDENECGLIAMLFLNMSTSTKKKFFSQNSHLKKFSGKAWVYLNELNDIDNAHLDDASSHILWHEINTLKLLRQWVVKDNAKAIYSWMDWIDPKIQEQLLVVAAQWGALHTFKMFHQEFKMMLPNDILACASRYGRVDIVQYVLSQTTPTTQDLVVAACQACCGEHLNVVEILCAQQDLTQHQQILDFALKEEQIDILNFLFRQGFVLDPSKTQWDRWIRYVIGSKNDEITPFLSSFLPHHPYAATLFGSAVSNGLLNTAKSLLPLFDHHHFSFHQAMNQLVNSGNADLKMIEFLINNCNADQVVGKHLIGEAALGGNWALVDQLVECFGTSEDYSEATWYAIHHKKTNLVKKYFGQCDLSFMNNALLLEAGRANDQEVIDMFYPHYTIDEVAKVAARLRVEGEPTCWDEKHLLTRYHNHLRKLEIEQAVEGEGSERRKRLM